MKARRSQAIDREEILKIIREKGNLDEEVKKLNLTELRQLHQLLFEEAVKAGKAKFGSDFDIATMKRKIDNTFEHIRRNMCPNRIEFCNRKNCDNYDPNCVARKIEDQISRLVSEILNPSSIGFWTPSKARW